MRAKIDSQWIRSIDGRLTFCGVYEEYYDEISIHWEAESTRNQYDRIYNDLIFPNLQGHDDKSIDEYVLEDYYIAIQAIVDRGQLRQKEQYVPYADASIQKFRYLIDVVVFVAASHGLCDYVFWGSCFAIPEDMTRDQVVKERIKLKKSLTIQEEYAVAEHLLTDETQRGQEMGLLLMFALGLRNNEACAANYGDIRALDSHPEVKCIWVYKTTIRGSSSLKASGKTRNADRIIPIPDMLEEFLERRREYLEDTVVFPKDGDITCVDDLPIACVGGDYFTRCSADKLTAAGRELFRNIKMDGDQLAFIDLELSNRSVSDELEEKDPSAYLLRRNFGTHMSILGLSESEIEYMIGHDIQDMYETRNEFVNDSRLLDMREKLNRRPILNTIQKEEKYQRMPMNRMMVLDGSGPQAYRIPISNNGTLKVHIMTNEPLDTLRVRVCSTDTSNPINMRAMRYSAPCCYERTIDVTKKYHELYEKGKTKP